MCPLQEWLEHAADFFGPTLDLGRVKVIASRWVLGSRRSEWTCNTVVRFRRPIRVEDLPSEATLIHELGHVWKHRAGQAQLLFGLLEQIRRRLGRDPYDFGGPVVCGKRTRSRTSRKKVRHRSSRSSGRPNTGTEPIAQGVAFTTTGYLDDLRRLVRGAGIGTADPARHTFAGMVDSSVARLVNLVLARFE